MNAHPVPPSEKPEPPRVYKFIIEPWSFRMKGDMLLWFVPGHTTIYGTKN